MKKDFEIPLVKDLVILQEEQYWPDRYAKRKLSTFFDFSKQKNDLSETHKAKAYVAMYVIGLAFVYFLAVKMLPLMMAAGIFVFLNIWPMFILLPVGFLVKQSERWVLTLVAVIKAKALRANKKMKVVGITGSFGKSAVRDFLFEILSKKGVVVKTSPGKNRLMDIVRTIDRQVNKKVKWFIVEMGAFRRGDVSQIMKLVKADWGIITNIDKKLIGANFELAEVIQKRSRVLVNWDDENIKNWVLKNKKYGEVKKCSFEDKSADFFVSEVKMNKSMSSFVIKHKRRKHKFGTKLFGRVNLENVTMAICMGLMMGIPAKEIAKTIAEIEAREGYLKLTRTGKGVVINDTEANNELAFEKMIGDVDKMRGKKALVTVGIAGLGEETKSVHQVLGKKIGDVFGEVVLVKESDMTRSMQVGIGRSKKKTKMWFLEDESKYEATARKLGRKYDWVVLENDLLDNYRTVKG